MLKLISKIIRNGKFRQTGPDFSRLRKETLEALPGLYPATRRPKRVREGVALDPFRFWMGQLAFFKGALRMQPGHLRVPGSALCYIRIPRAASTALSEAMLSLQYPQLPALELSPREINALADANLETRFHPSITASLIFTVVRSPFARIVSFYRSFFEESEMFIYEDYLFGIFRKDMSFRDFVKTAALIPDVFKDQHLKPQSYFLRPYQLKKLPVQVLKLEDIELLDAFSRARGLSLKPLNVAMQPYDYQEYYDLDTASIVNAMYAEDIRMWQYSHEYEVLKSRISGSVS